MRISPERSWARPAMSSSNVVLPTPLRPTTATVSPAAIERSRRSTMVVGPQPPVRPTTSSTVRSASKAGLPGHAEVHRAHLGPSHHLAGRPYGEHPAMDQDVDLGREAPDHVHVMLD